jgi:integrase
MGYQNGNICKVANMSIEKEPLDRNTLAVIMDKSQSITDYEILLLLRWTGCHPSVIVEKKYDLKETTNDDGKPIIQWKRPKKEGKDAFTSIMKSREIKFDVNKFMEKFRNRRRKKSRQYIYELVKRASLSAGYSGVSPMTFRHSVCVDLLNRGIPEVVVMQILNVSPRTMRRYAKYTDKGKVSILERVGW